MHDRRYQLRQAGLADLDQLLLVEEQCFETDRISRRQMRYLLTQAKSMTWVATDIDSKIASYGMILRPQPPKPARLYSLATLPDFRGQGIAAALLWKLVEALQERGHRACSLEVRKSDNRSQRLYRRCGFCPQKTLPNYYADGEAAIRMRLKLPNGGQISHEQRINALA
ncbi:MAG: GNAT family N-acetyltransferase [Porticoccaceae bacterium]|jgi:[ribosomal protein S18]-alanine N-acetyltransferase|nr:GNAT family N-acetyltransferase [Porticoccaceae bacterium]